MKITIDNYTPDTILELGNKAQAFGMDLYSPTTLYSPNTLYQVGKGQGEVPSGMEFAENTHTLNRALYSSKPAYGDNIAYGTVTRSINMGFEAVLERRQIFNLKKVKAEALTGDQYSPHTLYSPHELYVGGKGMGEYPEMEVDNY